MPLQIVRNDITKMKADAIVNAANNSLLGGGGVDGCIHRAAGPELLEECRTLNGCETGQAKITRGYRLPCRYVIHTVGPIWRDGNHGERELLRSCYLSSLQLALENGCESVAFPLISSGAYRFPREQALDTAVEAIGEFVSEHDMNVYLVIFDRSSYRIDERLFSDISDYIDRRGGEGFLSRYIGMSPEVEAAPADLSEGSLPAPTSVQRRKSARNRRLHETEEASLPAPTSLDEALSRIDESFSEMLLRKIDESGMTDAECYKRANIDRKLFSKIRSDRLYRPSKPTVIAFAIALRLPMEEMKEMLMKAGFALSRSSKFDIIVQYFIERGNYNVFEINEALFAFDQSLIGA